MKLSRFQLNKGGFILDKESLLRLGLDSSRIDLENSTEIYNPHTNKHIIKLFLIKDVNLSCPHCGCIGDYTLRSSINQRIKHASLLESKIEILLHRRVFICSCGKTFREPNNIIAPKKRITKELEMKILDTLKNINLSFSDVAKEFNVSTTTVKTIFKSRINLNRLPLTEVLCVDEVYNKHCGYHKYCFITYSPQLDKILDVLSSRNKEDLCGYFGKIPLDERKKVKYFSMDLYTVYKQVAQLCFPNALICADHFHVIKNLTDHFNAARIRIMKKYEHLKNKNDNWYWLYKKYWKLLLKASHNLGYKKFKTTRFGMYLDEHQIVDYMLEIDKDLKDAYELLNEYRNFNSTAKINTAADELDILIIKYHNSKLPEYYESYKLLKKWRTEIINSFNRVNGYVISNGGMERANRDIKTINRLAYGYTDFETFRNRIMYAKNFKKIK